MKTPKRLALLATVLLLGRVPSARAVDYYVSAAGNDANPGTSIALAWATVDAVSAATFLPGDRVLFEGDVRFSNGSGIYIDDTDSGTAAAPVTLTSYGNGRATIEPGPAALGLYAYNASGIVIRNLSFAGPGTDTANPDGIAFYADLNGDPTLPFLRIEDVEVSGFGGIGISVGGFNGNTAYGDVRIERVAVHDCAEGGITTYAENDEANQDVFVGDVLVHGITGVSGLGRPSGSGIVLGNVLRGTVERSIVYDNGTAADLGNGPHGILTYASRAITIRSNEVYDNRTASGADGNGITLGDLTADSIVEYNYTHGNDGAGIRLSHSWNNRTFANNQVRYNVSQDDSRLGPYGAIDVWGGVSSTEVYGNTIHLGPLGGLSLASGIAITNAGAETLDVASLHVRNNIVVTQDKPLLVASATQLDGATDLLLQGNDWFAAGGAFGVSWGAASYATLPAWRAGAGVERLGLTDVGTSADPQLTAPGAGPTFGDPDLLTTLDAYRLRAGSPLVDAGLDLLGLFGVAPGPRDYFGTALPQGAALDIGAHEQPPLPPLVLLRGALLATTPPTPPFAAMFPFDPLNPLTPVVMSPFVSGATDPGIAAALLLYEVYPASGASPVATKNGTGVTLTLP